MKKGSVIRLLAVFVLAMACLFAAACTTEKAKFKVTFDSDGGSAVQEQTIEKGGFALEPDAPTKAGYTFTGWTLDGEKFTFSETPVNDNITLKAAWTANTDTKYYVTVKVDGEDKTADYADAFELVSADGKYYLTGTTDTQADITAVAEANKGDSLSVADTSKLTGNIAGDESLALIVEYKTNEYTVSFDTGSEASVEAQTVKHGEKATDPNFTKAGYAVKWQEDGEDFSFDTPITANTELTLVLTANTDTKYYVTVKVDGEDKTADYAEAFELASADGKYYLTGTTDTQADISAAASAQKPEYYHVADTSVLTGNIAGDESLTLTVEYAVNTYTILFNAGGGSGTMPKMVLSYGETAELTANAFTKVNYTFAGWKCGEVSYTDGQEITNLSAEDGDELEFVAQWTLDDGFVRGTYDVPATDQSKALRVDSGEAKYFKVHKEGDECTVEGQDFYTDLIDLIEPGDTLTISFTMAAEAYAGEFFDNWTIGFWALNDGGSLPYRLELLKQGQYYKGYANGGQVQLINSYARSLAVSVTFNPYDTAKIKEQGGLKFRMMEKGGWAAVIIYGISVNKHLNEAYTEDFEGDTFSYVISGPINDPAYCGPSTFSAGREGETKMSFDSSMTDNDSFIGIRSDVLNAVGFADSISMDVWFSGTESNFYNFTTGAFGDIDVEIYAFREDGKYTEATPIFTYNTKTMQWYFGTWRTLTFDLNDETRAAFEAGGGIAVRLKFNDPADASKIWYRLLIDNLSITLADTAAVEIASSADTIEADIAADIAARFAGCYAEVTSVEESEGAYVATVRVSQDGMYDKEITVTYTLASAA